MKILVATIFIAGASVAWLAPAGAMSVAPLGQEAAKATNVVPVAKACSRGYQLTPNGCRKMKSR